MLRKLLIGLASLAVLSGPVQAAGTVPGFSLTPQFDALGKVAGGCKLYVIQAGTTSTPQNAYQDTALTLVQPNPMTCDSTGRLPQWFVADGTIKLRLTDRNGVQLYVGDNLLVLGPSSGGGGGGGTVDPTTIFQTGDVMWLDVDTTRTGWVRDNGRTIGSASSGATERANADTSALFVYLWTTYSNTICPVSGGRGASAAADFAANKTIGLPNKQGLIPGGLDGMGNSASNVWASVPVVSGLVTTPGSVIGATLNTLLTANLPPYTPSGTIANGALSFANARNTSTVNGSGNAIGTGPIGATGDFTALLNAVQATSTFTGSAQGGTSTAFNNVPKTVLGTFFRKL